LARDLHDGLLQSLTAATIQLRVSGTEAGPGVQERLDEIRALLADEQRRIRRFVEDNRAPMVPPKKVTLRDALGGRLEGLERQWGCEIPFQAFPADLTVPTRLARHIRHLVSEAVSNAARHGPASQVRITVTLVDGSLLVTIADNGRGCQGFSGFYDHEELRTLDLGPASLRSRVCELGGTFALDTSPAGTRIEAKLPL